MDLDANRIFRFVPDDDWKASHFTIVLESFDNDERPLAQAAALMDRSACCSNPTFSMRAMMSSSRRRDLTHVSTVSLIRYEARA